MKSAGYSQQQQPYASLPAAASRMIAIAAGGTGGHRYIGQAIGEAYQKHNPNINILFLSSREDVPLPLSQIQNWQYATVASSPMTGQQLGGKLRSSGNLVRGLWHARHLLKKQNVALAIGCGSYASAAVILAAKSLGLPTVIHEANDIPGRANRLLARFVDRILVGWPDMHHSLPQTPLEVGTPIRSDLLELASQCVKQPVDRGSLQLLVLGGSQGSRFLNQEAPEIVNALKKHGLNFRVFHQCGNQPGAAVLAAYQHYGIEALVEPFFNDLGTLYQNSDFAISCSGATSLEELAAFGIPCVLVPLRNAADDHQSANARAFAKATATQWMMEKNWDRTQLSEHIAALLKNQQLWQAQSDRMRAWWHRDAGKKIAEHCEALLNQRSMRTAHSIIPQFRK